MEDDLRNKAHAKQIQNDFDYFFMMFPADMLHTVLGGLIRYTCLWTLTVIKVSEMHARPANQPFSKALPTKCKIAENLFSANR